MSLAIKSVLLGLAIALVIASVLIGYALFISNGKDASTLTQQSVNAQLSQRRAHPPAETAETTLRAQSLAPSQSPTTANPWGITIDQLNGFVWTAEPGCDFAPTCSSSFPSVIGKYALSSGQPIQDFKEPPGFSSPLFLTTDPAGHVWFTQPNSSAIGELNPQASVFNGLDPQNQVWSQWHLHPGATPYDLVFDKNGNLWFAEFRANAIGFFNTRTHNIVENLLPTPGGTPYGITMDKHGIIWFTENKSGTGRIGSFTPTTSGTVTITEHTVMLTASANSATPSQLHLITSDQDGNIWYSEGFAGGIGMFHPATGSSKVFPVSNGICHKPAACSGTHISGISIDSRGYVWFDDSLNGRVGYLIPSTSQVVARTIPQSNAHPHDGLATDSNNNVWFTEEFGFMLVKWPTSYI